MRHTPGPWNYAPDTQGRMRVYSGGREVVRALSTHGTRKLSKVEREGNACLIAAAPDMLEALKIAKIVMEDDFPRASRAIGAVIAKATGGAA